jgi:hypothetical protein
MQKRALADARLSDHSDPLAFGQIKVCAAENMNSAGTFNKRFAQVAHGEQLTHIE